jgi:hypothetical protein
MKRLLLIALLLPTAHAEVGPGDFPSGTVWYLHADFERMRATASGREMYRWLDGEVFVEINDKIGIDLNREVDRLTAFSHDGMGTVILVEGPVSKTTKDKVLALVAADANLDVLEFAGKTYYHASEGTGHVADDGPLKDLDESAYFSFELPDKVVVASEKEQLHELLENGGRITGSASHDGALFVLTADKDFVQAGMRTERFVDDEDDWDSNILRNTEEVAFLASDRGGLLAIEARLKSRDARMAESIASIANGLISLQLFNSELGPEVRTLIQSTKVEVIDKVLTISTVFDPDLLMQLVDE